MPKSKKSLRAGGRRAGRSPVAAHERLLSPQQSVQLDSFEHLLRGSVETIKSLRQASGRSAKSPPFERSESKTEIRCDFGHFSVVFRKTDSAFRLERSDGSDMGLSFSVLDADASEIDLIAEARKCIASEHESAARKLTACTLLVVSSIHSNLVQSLTIPALLRGGPRVDIGIPDHLLARTIMGAPPLSVELALKFSEMKGRLLERFQLQSDECVVLRGRRHERAAIKGGSTTAAKAGDRWKARFLRLSRIVQSDHARSITDGCVQIAKEELRETGRSDRSKALGKTIARGLKLRFKQEISELEIKLRS